MKRAFIVGVTISIIAVSLVAGFLLTDLAGGQKAANKVYSSPISVGEKTYVITVVTNETSEPKIYLPENENTLKYFSVDFIGPPGNAPFFFNITYPNNLVWGNFSLVAKYYVQSPDRYMLSNNSTHQSVYMTYTHFNVNCHFEIRGTEGAW